MSKRRPFQLINHLDCPASDPPQSAVHSATHSSSVPEHTPEHACSEFFKEYDRRFVPGEVLNNQDMTTEEQLERVAAVERMIDILEDRFQLRAIAAKKGETPDPRNLGGRDQLDCIRYLAAAQAELYQERFPDGNGGIDRHKYTECFEKFSNGELRNAGRPGEREPDGSHFFLFAEFAFLAVAVAENPCVWKLLLQTFVQCQEIFIEVYRPNGVPSPRLEDYKAKNFQKDRQVDSCKKEALRHKYQDMSPGGLERSAADIMRRAQSVLA